MTHSKALDSRMRRIDEVGYDFEAAEKVPVAGCNLCGSTDAVEVARRDRYGFPAACRVCARCGLGFLSPRLTAAEYRRFYEHAYRPLVSAYHGRTIDAATIQDGQRVYAAELIGLLEPFLDRSPASVIDIGGSTGVVGAAVRDAFGSEVTVLDPAPAELEIAAAGGLETVLGFVEDFDGRGRTWDLVLVCQTVDHLLDLARALRMAAELMAPRARAFVDVLDFRRAIRDAGSVEGAVKIDHPYYLTRETARAYLRTAGLKVLSERLSADGHWGFVVTRDALRAPNWEELAGARDRLLEEATHAGG